MNRGAEIPDIAAARAARRRSNLARLLNPRSIVFIGGRGLDLAIASCERIGFAGDIWVVSSSRDEIAGHRCYRSLADLPAAPDAAFVVVRRETTIEVVRELAAMGAAGAVCHAAGFAEVGGAGVALQQDLAAAAGDMALVGPNCYGFLNFLDGAALWADSHGGGKQNDGIAIVSQSGNISLNFTFTDRSVPIAHLISVGNQAVLGVGDFIPPLADDPRVKAIGLYIEGLNDIEGFSRAAEYALERGVPIVALKVGTSDVARRLAMSHTFSLAGSDACYNALFDRLGIIRAPSLTAFMETLKLFAVAGPLGGGKLGVLTCSGGDAALAADIAQPLGLSFPELDAAQKAALGDQLPAFVSIANPLDYNTSIWGDPVGLLRCFTTLMQGCQDATLLIMDMPIDGEFDPLAYEQCIDALTAASAATGGKAMVAATFPELLPAKARKRMIASGLTPLQGLEEALQALAGAAWYGENRAAWQKAARAGTLRLPAAPVPAGPARQLDEPESKARLAAFGLPLPQGRVVEAAAAPDVAESLGFPVVVKAVNADLAHKSDVGGVAIGLTNAAAVAAAVAGMRGLAERFLVESMVEGAVAELIVGVVREPPFGLALVVGSGGELVNLIEDSATLLLPTDRVSVEKALDGLKGARLLAGYRGRPRGDAAAAVDTILAVAAYAESERDRLLELDVNPLLVLPQGQGAVAVDAMIRLAAQADRNEGRQDD